MGVEVSVMHGITIRLRSPNPSVPITIMERSPVPILSLATKHHRADWTDLPCHHYSLSTTSEKYMRLHENKCVRNDVQAFGSVRVRKI